MAAWKTYLPVENYDPSAVAKGLTLIFDDGTTAVSEVETLPTTDGDAVYTVNGVRVEHPTAKGIYIQNGKKVMIP